MVLHFLPLFCVFVLFLSLRVKCIHFAEYKQNVLACNFLSCTTRHCKYPYTTCTMYNVHYIFVSGISSYSIMEYLMDIQILQVLISKLPIYQYTQNTFRINHCTIFLHHYNNMAKYLAQHRNHQSRLTVFVDTLRSYCKCAHLSLIRNQDVVGHLMNSQFQFCHYFPFLIIVLKLAYTPIEIKSN